MIDILVKQFGLNKDDIIDLLPFVLQEIRNYTNQYFLTKTNSKVLKIEEGKITVKDGSVFQIGDTVELLNSENNILLYQIKTINDNEIETEQPLINELTTNGVVMIKLAFKVNLKTIQSMINYSIKFNEISGIKSQGLGGYTVQFATPSDKGETIYPLELYGGLNSLRKTHDDFQEYRRKGYVRFGI